MASIIRVKRSTGTAAPTSINYGELAVTVGLATHGTFGGRLFAGDNTSPNPDPIEVGGKYYTDLIRYNKPGEIREGRNADAGRLSNGFIPVMDRESAGNPGGAGNIANMPRVDFWGVDQLTFDDNVISTNATNADLILRTNGTGTVNLEDDKKLTFGTGEDGSIYYNNASNQVIVTGVEWKFEGTRAFFDNVGISSNVISTKSGGGNTLYIDPYPDGLSSDGLVIVKGSLQVDGTTTTVNSTTSTLNDPIMNIGDVTSELTIMTYDVASGVSTMTVDKTVGINTGDIISATGLPNSGVTTVTAYNSTTKVVTFTGTTTAGISTGSQITVTHAYDTNTDRGISFNYNESSGTAANKTGFFGYNDSAGENSNAPARSLTYIPDSTITANVVAGTRGFLDIKGIYFQSGDFDAVGNGIVYFDTTGKMVGAASTNAGISTSNFVLTTNAAGIPKWTTTLDGGTF
tara:strand:- start:553 stop:1932 length:1380 start_codon:yes stop_codon:yes gene_type:complete